MAKKRAKSATAQSSDGLATLVERDLTALAGAGKLTPNHGLEQPAADVVTLLTRGGPCAFPQTLSTQLSCADEPKWTQELHRRPNSIR